MAHFRSLAPASAGLGSEAEAAASLGGHGIPYWFSMKDHLVLPPSRTQLFRPCPWLGEFIPRWKSWARLLKGSAPDVIVQPGMLCPKCTELNNSLTTTVRAAETVDTLTPSEGKALLVFSHHESLQALINSGHSGCHLCTIFWQELETEEYARSIPNYLKSKLQYTKQCRDFKVTLLQFPDVYKRRKFVYRLDVHNDSNDRISILGLDINHKSAESNLVKSSVSRAHRTDSTHHMKLLKQWLYECVETHESCRLRMTSPVVMPKRLLDLSRADTEGIVRLIEPGEQEIERIGYAALSYCWGTGRTCKLTTSTMPTLYRGVLLSAFPRTVQDAIRVTLAVDLQYLWVDALCIQQDSIADWNREAKNMMSVYSNGLLTIAATGASSCEDGIFGVRDPLVYLHCPLFDIDDEHEVSASVSFSPLISWHSFATLHGRGWVVQERLLAPRTINFGVSVVWECREKLISDCTTKDTDVGQNKMRKKFAELVLSPNGSEQQRRELMKLWYIILAQYTGSALSRKSDRLAAINGIMSSFQKQGYTPWFGLWKPLSIWELMWSVPIAYYNDEARERGPDWNDFPTWSWAHLNLDVKYELLPYQAPYNDVVYSADLSQNETCDCKDHEFRCEQRKLFSNAPLLNIKIKASETQFQKLNRVSHLLDVEVADSSTNIVWEDGSPDAFVGLHDLILLVVRKRSDEEYRCAGLVLAPLNRSGGSFQRIGLADFEINGELYDMLKKQPCVDVTLI